MLRRGPDRRVEYQFSSCLGGQGSRCVQGEADSPLPEGLRLYHLRLRSGSVVPDQATPCSQSQIEQERYVAKAVNGAGGVRRGVVRSCPLETDVDSCEWHASGTAVTVTSAVAANGGEASVRIALSWLPRTVDGKVVCSLVLRCGNYAWLSRNLVTRWAISAGVVS